MALAMALTTDCQGWLTTTRSSPSDIRPSRTASTSEAAPSPLMKAPTTEISR
jgi:hypothetical protein